MQVTPRLEGGGVEQVTLDTARAVTQAGGRALTVSWGGALEAAHTAAGGALFRLPVHKRDPLTLTANVGRLRDLIQREAVDMVHVRSRAPAFSAIAAARAAGVPVVATYHGIYQARGPVKRWYNGVMTRADLTLANSLFTRDHILTEHRLDPDRIVVVPEGIDTDRFEPSRISQGAAAQMRAHWGLDDDDHRAVLLLAARLTGWKGQAVMIQALALLAEASRPWLVLAGKVQKPGEEERLRGVAQKAGVADRVLFVGSIADMPAAYRAADLIVAPSTQPESFGRGVAEAGAMERLVIASPLGGPSEILVHGQTGWLAAAGDAPAWAIAVQAALATRLRQRRTMELAARKRILAGYSLRAMTAATFAVYRRMVERQE